jgi:hypothetical protein
MSLKEGKFRIIHEHQRIRELIDSAIKRFNKIDGCPYLECVDCPLWSEDPELDLCKKFLRILGKEQYGSIRKAN